MTHVTSAMVFARAMNLLLYSAVAHFGYFIGWASKDSSITRLLAGPDISSVEIESMGTVMVVLGALGIALEMLR